MMNSDCMLFARLRSSSFWYAGSMILALSAGIACASGQSVRISSDRGTATVLVEPYATNIVRVSISLRKHDALAAPGYGIVAKSDASGWTVTSDRGADVLQSAGLKVTVEPQPLDSQGEVSEIGKFFSGSTGYVGLDMTTADGSRPLHLNGWQMSVPNYKDGNHNLEYDRRPTDPPFFTVGTSFAAPDDDSLIGLSQRP